jgi:hypothetical protein
VGKSPQHIVGLTNTRPACEKLDLHFRPSVREYAYLKAKADEGAESLSAVLRRLIRIAMQADLHGSRRSGGGAGPENDRPPLPSRNTSAESGTGSVPPR